MSESPRTEELVEHLRNLGYTVTAPKPEPPPDECNVCGVTDEIEYLVDITVETAHGEEGSSWVRMYRCEYHLAEVIDGLQKLGFVHHHHGSTDYLADAECPGDQDPAACPTPREYNNSVVLTRGGSRDLDERWRL